MVLSYAKDMPKNKVQPTKIEVEFGGNHIGGDGLDGEIIADQPGSAAGFFPKLTAHKISISSLGSTHNLLDLQLTESDALTAGPMSNEMTTLRSSDYLAQEEDQQQGVAYAGTSSGLDKRRDEIAAKILERAYNRSKRKKHLLVLINPNGGPGKARHIFQTSCLPILEMGQCKVTVIETTHRFHAQELARDTPDILKYDGIVCCSGDGTPHEVINGLSQRKGGDAAQALAGLPLCQLPCGSGNSLAISLNGTSSPTLASLGMVKGIPMPVDLMMITQDDKQCLSFLTQAFGTIADADLGTEHLRWMGGTRFLIGTLQYTLAAKTYPCDIYVKYTQETTRQLKDHYNQHLQAHQDRINGPPASPKLPTETNTQDFMVPRFGTVKDPVPADWTHLPDCSHLSLMYCGKMPWVSSDCMMFPASLPTDGTMDLFITRTNRMNRLEALQMLKGMERGQHVYHDYVQYSKAVAYRLVPKEKDGHFSVDGEKFPYRPFQVEVLPAVGCLLSNNGIWTLTGFGDS